MQADNFLNKELSMLLESYSDYIIKNWQSFESGNYKTLTERPALYFKHLLSEDIVRDNLPQLTPEEKLLVNIDSLEVP